jgi:7-cyano-7-deazaguanine synthase in queuosine biosynthesis
MNRLEIPFRFQIRDGGKSIVLREGDHVRVYPTGDDRGFGGLLTRRQVDLLRIATAVHVADGLVRRRRRTANRQRCPVLDLEVMDAAFWTRPATTGLLKTCVDFLSGGDDWSFRFRQCTAPRKHQTLARFRDFKPSPIVALYSGGLDSAAGLAARLAAMPGSMFIPVTLRHQMQRAKLVRDHFQILLGKGLTSRADLKPFQVGAFIRNHRMRRDFGVQMREVTHRCRPMLYMAVAGAVAGVYGAGEVEVYESGVGSVNLPLVGGPADHRTTRSSHPHFLGLMSALVGRVNEADVRYVLPFADRTKAEMVGRLRELGLEELASRSVSCTLHPLRRGGGRQCGYCAACVYRRQAMQVAGIPEDRNAYDVDLFTPPTSSYDPDPAHLVAIRAYQQQVGRLAELDAGRLPSCYRTYLYATHAVATDTELEPHVEVHRRYRREWDRLIADARRLGLPWATPARPHALAGGVTL